MRSLLLFLLTPFTLFSALFNPSLIEPYSRRVLSKDPYHSPFVALYKNQTHAVAFLSSKHASSLTSPTYKTIERAIQEFAPEILIVEGIAYQEPFNSKIYIQKANEEAATNFEHCSEVTYSIYLASQKAIPFVGGEPNHNFIYDEMLRQGYTSDDFYGFYTVRQVPQWELEKKQPTKERIEEFIKLYSRILTKAVTMNYDQFLTWYQNRSGYTFRGSDITTFMTFPVESKGSFFQTLAHKVTVMRDTELLNTLEKTMASKKRILIIYGSAHQAVNRAALESVFGKAEYVKWY